MVNNSVELVLVQISVVLDGFQAAFWSFHHDLIDASKMRSFWRCESLAHLSLVLLNDVADLQTSYPVLQLLVLFFGNSFLLFSTVRFYMWFYIHVVVTSSSAFAEWRRAFRALKPRAWIKGKGLWKFSENFQVQLNSTNLT
jgi:hypothetical protein